MCIAKATVFSKMLQGEALRVFEVRKSQVTFTDNTTLFDGLVQDVTSTSFLNVRLSIKSAIYAITTTRSL